MISSFRELFKNNHVPATTRVALLYGGKSSERDVSIMSGTAVGEALHNSGYQVQNIDTIKANYIEALKLYNPDVVFICLHGKCGEDGSVQGVCEELGLAYTGSGILASSLAIDKVRSKEFYLYHGIKTPNFVSISSKEEIDIEKIIEKVGTRAVIKPVCEGSTIGMSFANGTHEIVEGVMKAREYDSVVLVEKMVQGVEVTVGAVGNDEVLALPVLEVVPDGELYDYDAKYTQGGSRHYCPARIDDLIAKECQAVSIAAHKIFGCAGISRSDLIIDAYGNCWMLETNTVPGMTATSLIPDAAQVAGLEFGELCRLYIDLAIDAYYVKTKKGE